MMHDMPTVGLAAVEQAQCTHDMHIICKIYRWACCGRSHATLRGIQKGSELASEVRSEESDVRISSKPQTLP
jgi:hypothetical protein